MTKRGSQQESGDLMSRSAVMARAEHIIELLSTCFIRDGWSFDHVRAARFLECLRTFDENNGDSPAFAEMLAWVRDHGQSFDWVFDGDPAGMICKLAHQSAGRRRLRVLEGI
jgi:hypothetical protein